MVGGTIGCVGGEGEPQRRITRCRNASAGSGRRACRTRDHQRRVLHDCGVAQRAGLEVQVVKDMWANTPELISAALMAYAGRTMPVPDTGSLCEDLVGYAKGFAAAVNSPTGRRLLDAVVATPKDWDVSGWRSAFFQAHRRLVQSSAVLRPAHYRRGLRSRGGPSIERHSHESLRPGELHCAPACSAFGSVTRHGSAAAPLGVTRPGPCQ